MFYVAVITSLCTIVFLIRYIQERKQIMEITSQLLEYNKQETEMKVNMTLSNKHLEALAVEINQTITGRAEANANTHRVERELKQAISSMSHDLRTPLTSIIGYMQLVEDKDLSEEKKGEYLAVAQKRAVHLQKLLSDFFALSMIDSEDYPLQLESVKINTLVQEVLLNYYDSFQAADRRPTIDITSEELVAVMDKTACERVVENLLLNALQHSDGDITIQLERQGKMAVLKVKNYVNNKEELKVERLFERFYTADESRSERSGIGLTIVHSLMQRMNGEVEVEVENGEFSIICKWELAK